MRYIREALIENRKREMLTLKYHIERLREFSGDSVGSMSYMTCQGIIKTCIRQLLEHNRLTPAALWGLLRHAGIATGFVTLVLSDEKLTSSFGEASISQILVYLRLWMHGNHTYETALCVMEFIKELATADPEHKLPIFYQCQHNLANVLLIDKNALAKNQAFFGVSDVYPMLEDLTQKLTLQVEWMDFAQDSASRATMSKDLTEFGALAVGIGVAAKGFTQPLEALFDRLLKATEKFFLDFVPGWVNRHTCDSYGNILMVLYRISRDVGDKESERKILNFLSRHKQAFNMLIQHFSDSQDVSYTRWLYDYKPLLTLKSRERLARMQLWDCMLEARIFVCRPRVLEESLDQLYTCHGAYEIIVEFLDEVATGPGVLREWFSLICKAIFEPGVGLFTPCENDRRRFFPHHGSGANPSHLRHFRFCGKVIAFAIREKITLNLTFASFFVKQLAGRPIGWEDARDADPALYKSCKKILEMSAEEVNALYLTFDTDVELYGSKYNIELCEGGSEIPVTVDNRLEYVNAMIQKRLAGLVSEQAEAFADGFRDLLKGDSPLKLQEFFAPLDLEDFDLMLGGECLAIRVEDWKLHTEYYGYSVTDEQIQWFWQVVEDMSPKQRTNLLYFVTSVTNLPPEGFAGLPLKFAVENAATDMTMLPTASTCFYRLYLPAYPSLDVMRSRIHVISDDHIAEGFGLA